MCGIEGILEDIKATVPETQSLRPLTTRLLPYTLYIDPKRRGISHAFYTESDAIFASRVMAFCLLHGKRPTWSEGSGLGFGVGRNSSCRLGASDQGCGPMQRSAAFFRSQQ